MRKIDDGLRRSTRAATSAAIALLGGCDAQRFEVTRVDGADIAVGDHSVESALINRREDFPLVVSINLENGGQIPCRGITLQICEGASNGRLRTADTPLRCDGTEASRSLVGGYGDGCSADGVRWRLVAAEADVALDGDSMQVALTGTLVPLAPAVGEFDVQVNVEAEFVKRAVNAFE